VSSLTDKISVSRVSTVLSELGEGPCWSGEENALWYVDITSKRIHRLDITTNDSKYWDTREKVSFVLPFDDGGFVVGLPGQLARFSPKAGTFETIALVEGDKPGNRLNDAVIDSQNRLWFGSMDDAERSANGALYRWNGTQAPVRADDGYVISNGPAQSADGHFFYHTDTLTRTIYRFALDKAGALGDKQRFIEIEKGAGFPDGTTMDAEGCLWIALYGGWAVRRYAPDGTLMATVTIPCANVTNLAFGGADLRTAFVTTARQKLDSTALQSQPLAGALFSFRAPVSGMPQPKLKFGGTQ